MRSGQLRRALRRHACAMSRSGYSRVARARARRLHPVIREFAHILAAPLRTAMFDDEILSDIFTVEPIE